MLDLRILKDLHNDAIRSMKKDSNGDKINRKIQKILFFIYWYGLPFTALIIVFVKSLFLTNLQNYIGTIIALFTGLFFSLLLRLGDKLRAEKINENIDINNYYRFKENLKQISSITQYIILLGILIFSLLVLNSIVKSQECLYIEVSLTAIVVFMLIRYIIAIGFLLQRFHFTLRDEINNTIK